MPAVETTDTDPIETQEWLESLEAVVLSGGGLRGRFLLERLEEKAQELVMVVRKPPYSAYQNTISLEPQAVHPGDVALDKPACNDPTHRRQSRWECGPHGHA
jgi:pyruvate dehydrogenase E1 component